MFIFPNKKTAVAGIMLALSSISYNLQAAPLYAPAINLPHLHDDKLNYNPWIELNPADTVKDVSLAYVQARKDITAICELAPEAMNFDNTFGALDRIALACNKAGLPLNTLSGTMDSPALREAEAALIDVSSDYSAWFSGNKALYQALQTAAEQDWVKDLKPYQQRYIKETLIGFKNSGIALPADKKAELDELNKQLAQLTQQFGEMIQDANDAAYVLITDEAELEGTSEMWKKQAAAAALKRGFGTKENPQWIITTAYSSYFAFSQNCSVEATRRQAWEMRNSIGAKAPDDTAAISYQILETRQQIAHLLGFAHYADLTTIDRMVGTGANALNFVDTMLEKVKPEWQKETLALQQFIAAENKQEGIQALNPWDTLYYGNQLSKKSFDFDLEQMRPYLVYDRVIKTLFSVMGELYGFTVTEVPSSFSMDAEAIAANATPVWHPDVKVYLVTDSKSGNKLGCFYLDAFPREGKGGGAWVNPMPASPSDAEGKHDLNWGTLCTNVSPAVDGKPSLLSFDDIVGLFHEFGHMMHGMLNTTVLSGQSNCNVAWDFVEMPSQMTERWVWEPAIIKQFAKHYETGETLPDEMIEKFLAGRFFMPATGHISQLYVAKTDLEMHINYDKLFKGKDIDQANLELLAEWTPEMSVDKSSAIRSLTHCMSGGYAAGYYSYKWSEVLAADAYTRFAKEGIINKETGASMREEILSKGGSRSAADIYKNFMGREPNADALLEEEGMIPKK